jgi:endoglucanase
LRDDNALAQISHLVSIGLKAFRLPVGWQFLVNSVAGDPLNDTNFAAYDALVQGCLDSGASLCLIDIHNYARWDGEIIGQGGPSHGNFASLWAQLAGKYATKERIAFGVMNEPHDVPDITAWAGSVQTAVTAIRTAGATSQMILLPGNDWTSAATFVSDGIAAELSTVTKSGWELYRAGHGRAQVPRRG